jgi:hypothetical protein
MAYRGNKLLGRVGAGLESCSIRNCCSACSNCSDGFDNCHCGDSFDVPD